MKSKIGLTTLQVIREIVRNRPRISSISIRMYQFPVFPSIPPGSEPARGDMILKIGRRDFTLRKVIEDKIESLKKHWNLGIESCVIEGRTLKHIPMMDFLVEKSPKNIRFIEQIWKKFVVPKFGKGVIIETDHSYHFIGTEKLLTRDEFVDFLGTSLICAKKWGRKFENFTDVQYVGNSLIKKSLCLRISSFPSTKYTNHVVYEF